MSQYGGIIFLRNLGNPKDKKYKHQFSLYPSNPIQLHEFSLRTKSSIRVHRSVCGLEIFRADLTVTVTDISVHTCFMRGIVSKQCSSAAKRNSFCIRCHCLRTKEARSAAKAETTDNAHFSTRPQIATSSGLAKTRVYTCYNYSSVSPQSID
jgi:hypothetical protein